MEDLTRNLNLDKSNEMIIEEINQKKSKLKKSIGKLVYERKFGSRRSKHEIYILVEIV